MWERNLDLLYLDQINDLMAWYRQEQGLGGMGGDGVLLNDVPCLNLEVARGTPSDSYRNPLLEVFGLTNTHEQVLSPSSPSALSLQSMLLNVAHDMSKTFPIKWTNQVYYKLVSVSITTSSDLLHYISNSTLNSRLKSGGHSGMNPTTIQVLGRGASDFHQGRR